MTFSRQTHPWLHREQSGLRVALIRSLEELEPLSTERLKIKTFVNRTTSYPKPIGQSARQRVCSICGSNATWCEWHAVLFTVSLQLCSTQVQSVTSVVATVHTGYLASGTVT